MISHVTKLSYTAVIMSHDALNSPHCSHAAEIFNFLLVHIHSNARNYIFSLSSFPIKDSKDEKTLIVASGDLYHVTTTTGFDLGLITNGKIYRIFYIKTNPPAPFVILSRRIISYPAMWPSLSLVFLSNLALLIDEISTSLLAKSILRLSN